MKAGDAASLLSWTQCQQRSIGPGHQPALLDPCPGHAGTLIRLQMCLIHDFQELVVIRGQHTQVL